MNLSLVRHAYLPQATLGRLFVGNLILATLEEPWIADPAGPGGQRREPGKKESCVPDGVYSLIRHSTPHFPNTWALSNAALGVYHLAVPAGLLYGRSAILLHAGNTTEDTLGCILVGRRHGRLDNKDSILESRAGMEDLRSALGGDQHTLTIRPTAGTCEVIHD